MTLRDRGVKDTMGTGRDVKCVHVLERDEADHFTCIPGPEYSSPPVQQDAEGQAYLLYPSRKNRVNVNGYSGFGPSKHVLSFSDLFTIFKSPVLEYRLEYRIPSLRQFLGCDLTTAQWFVLLLLVFALLPNMVSCNEDANSIDHADEEYDTEYDHIREYRRWREQSILGKGRKIGDPPPSIPDHIRLKHQRELQDIDNAVNFANKFLKGETDIAPGDDSEDNIGSDGVDSDFLEQGKDGMDQEQNVGRVKLGKSFNNATFIREIPKPIEIPDPSNEVKNVASLEVEIQSIGISTTGLPNTESNSVMPEAFTSRVHELENLNQQEHEDDFEEKENIKKNSFNIAGSTNINSARQGYSHLNRSEFWKNPRNTGNRLLEENNTERSEGKPAVYIAGLFPWSEDIPAGAVGRGVLPAVWIALEHINNDTRTDRKYELKIASNDTKCDMAVATRALFDRMAKSPTTITAMLFGDACYNVTGPIAQIAEQWNMFQLSYADTDPMLSDRDKFPNFYRTVPSDSDFNPARLALLRYFNWTTVGTLFQDAKLGSARYGYAHNRFDSLMAKHKINVSLVESFSDDPESAIKNMKAHDVRIIVGNFDQVMARRVFCSAHKHSMYGPKHQWIILGTYDVDWWMEQDEDIDCTPQQLNKTLHGYLATDVLSLTTNDEITESGRTSAEYMQLYNEARGIEYSKYHGYAYDGVWVVAKALDRLLDDVSNISSEMFRGQLFGKVLNETSFQGVTGRVQFLHGDRVGSITILQMQAGNLVKIGEYHALYDSLDFSDGEPILWIDGKPPVDRSIKIEELRIVSVPVYIGLVVMAAFGITMAALFLALNIRFRNHRYIKMSSPNMNNLIIVGCILCYVSIVLLGADPDHNNRELFRYLCTARSWTLALGFTLAFGAMFGKTWRVHAIFTNIKLNKKVIKDYKLMLIVLVLVLLDAAILVTWQILDPFEKATKRLTPEVYEDYEIIPKIDYCTSHRMEVWLGALYAYKGLLLAFGCFLAWETRHVSIPALNDSKYIGMSVYNVVIMCVCGAAVSFIIQDKPTQSFIIIGLFIIFCTTITLCLVFLPKVIQLKRNPKGDEGRVRATLKKTTNKFTKSEYSVYKEKIRLTTEENRRLRGFLEQKVAELESLLEQLGDDVTKAEVRLKSALLHKKVAELQNTESSPGKLSVKSCLVSEFDAGSTYSEISGTTTVYLSESPPNTRLLKNRFGSTKTHTEAIEMVNPNRFVKKNSVTIPPPAEDEAGMSDDDPFGGVYLGPSDSPPVQRKVDVTYRLDNQHASSTSENDAHNSTNHVTSWSLPYSCSNASCTDSLLDHSPGAPARRQQLVPRSLRIRRRSSPLDIWPIEESCLEEPSPGQVTDPEAQPLVQRSATTPTPSPSPSTTCTSISTNFSPCAGQLVQQHQQLQSLSPCSPVQQQSLSPCSPEQQQQSLTSCSPDQQQQSLSPCSPEQQQLVSEAKSRDQNELTGLYLSSHQPALGAGSPGQLRSSDQSQQCSVFSLQQQQLQMFEAGSFEKKLEVSSPTQQQQLFDSKSSKQKPLFGILESKSDPGPLVHVTAYASLEQQQQQQRHQNQQQNIVLSHQGFPCRPDEQQATKRKRNNGRELSFHNERNIDGHADMTDVLQTQTENTLDAEMVNTLAATCEDSLDVNKDGHCSQGTILGSIVDSSFDPVSKKEQNTYNNFEQCNPVNLSDNSHVSVAKSKTSIVSQSDRPLTSLFHDHQTGTIAQNEVSDSEKISETEMFPKQENLPISVNFNDCKLCDLDEHISRQHHFQQQQQMQQQQHNDTVSPELERQRELRQEVDKRLPSEHQDQQHHQHHLQNCLQNPHHHSEQHNQHHEQQQLQQQSAACNAGVPQIVDTTTSSPINIPSPAWELNSSLCSRTFSQSSLLPLIPQSSLPGATTVASSEECFQTDHGKSPS